MEKVTERRDIRLMSSLRDLRLETEKKQTLTMDDGRRKTRKFCPIKQSAQDKEIYQNFTVKAKTKNKLDKELILKSLSGHFIFSSLIEDKSVHEMLLDKFQLCKVNQNEYLMKQNDNASSFFILHEGRLSVEINGDPKRKIYPGEGFGELALLYSAPRSASIKAEKPSFLWYIDRSTFRNFVETIIEKNFSENRKFVEHNKFFTYLTQEQKDKIASIGITQKFQKKSKICKEGELASSMFILKSGELRRTMDGTEVGVLKPGDSFQEYAALNKNQNRRETITASQDSEILALGTEDIEAALGRNLSIIVLRNKANGALKSSKAFNELQSEYLEKIIDTFKIRKIGENQIAIKKDDKCQKNIFFVIEGQYECSRNEGKQELYGHESIMDKTDEAKYNFEVKFKTEGKIAMTSKSEIQAALGCSLQQVQQKSKDMRKIIQKHNDNRNQRKNIAENIQLSDFHVVKKLGEGQFGTVYLVTDENKTKFYALKCISKYETVKCKLEKHLLNEKNVLEQINSPFAVDYIRSYKDPHYIYFLMEFINGLELFDAIRIIGILSVDQCRFYTSILLHVIESMHTTNIIYRDLKPENVMVGEDGYLKLIDMGTCKHINQKSIVQKTFTIIGTPNYMAPQILAGKGYTYSVDLWSLGVILYEFMAGYVPFGEEAEDPYEIYEEILKNPLKFPKHMSDKNTISFISQVLNKTPEARLGGSYSALKNHPFFQGIDWIKAPFLIPKDKFVDIQKEKAQVKPLSKVLKVPSKAPPNRKDLSPNWDETF